VGVGGGGEGEAVTEQNSPVGPRCVVSGFATKRGAYRHGALKNAWAG